MDKAPIQLKNARKNVIFSGVGYALPLVAALATIPVMVISLGTDLSGNRFIKCRPVICIFIQCGGCFVHRCAKASAGSASLANHGSSLVFQLHEPVFPECLQGVSPL